ncbi:MAG: hemerythrin domain-containing protein [Acidobacteria bacterium]|nr:hemerythrin domain-containing protein [Acidobacteriota bacterium]
MGDCHRRIEHFLDVLVLITEQAEGGPLTSPQRGQLEGALTYFATAAPRHTADEEESLFPKLRASGDRGVVRVLAVMDRLERDHSRADERHRAVDAIVRRWLADDRLAPADAAALQDHLAALKALYAVHIGIEDRELFPAAGRALTPEDLGAIGREMAARRAVRHTELP